MKSRTLPLYQQAAEQLLQRLQANEWREGAVLPSEFALAAQHRVSQGTMRKALDKLVDEGVLLRRQGIGTFVAERREFIGTARATRLGDVSGKEKICCEFVEISRTHASAYIAEELSLPRSTPLWRVTRLLRVGAALFGVDQAFLPTLLFPTLDAKRLQRWQANLKQMCLTDFAVDLVEKKVSYRAVLPSQDMMLLLQTKYPLPLLERVRVMGNRQDKPMLWGVTTFKTDEFGFCPHLANIS